jgi:hypothetical protein
MNFNVKKAKLDDAAELKKLQALRQKANKDRKGYWSNRIDEHFGLK